MKEIIPAVMPEDFEDLEEKIGLVHSFVKTVQIDVMDGKFVPSISWPYNDDNHFERIQKQDEGMPYWEDVDFSVDLMVSNPKEEVPKWIDAGVSRVIIHIESLEDDDVDFVKQLKEEGQVEICLALAPTTSNDELEKFKGYFDSIQFMGIEKVGYQGEEFVEAVLDKISNFKKENPDVLVGIDGGVNFDNVEDLVKAGADRIVSGSVIFESDDVKETIEEMKEML